MIFKIHDEGRDSGNFIPRPFLLVAHILILGIGSFLIASIVTGSFSEAVPYLWFGLLGNITWALQPLVELMR